MPTQHQCRQPPGAQRCAVLHNSRRIPSQCLGLMLVLLGLCWPGKVQAHACSGSCRT